MPFFLVLLLVIPIVLERHSLGFRSDQEQAHEWRERNLHHQDTPGIRI